MQRIVVVPTVNAAGLAGHASPSARRDLAAMQAHSQPPPLQAECCSRQQAVHTRLVLARSISSLVGMLMATILAACPKVAQS
jgi:hypothetical protein